MGSALRSKLIVGHGSIIDVVKVMDEDMNEGESSSAATSGDTAVEIIFDDDDNNDRKDSSSSSSSSVRITMAIMAIGYTRKEESETREDRLNGLFKVGFGNDQFLPLKSIGEEAEIVAEQIVNQLSL